MHVNISEEPLYTKFRCKMPQTGLSPERRQTLCASCAVEMHFNISEELRDTEIYRQNGAAQLEHPDQAPAFAPTVRTPQCGHTVWEKSYLMVLLNCSNDLHGDLFQQLHQNPISSAVHVGCFFHSSQTSDVHSPPMFKLICVWIHVPSSKHGIWVS